MNRTEETLAFVVRHHPPQFHLDSKVKCTGCLLLLPSWEAFVQHLTSDSVTVLTIENAWPVLDGAE